jgi:hypothetical protein
MSDVFTPNSHWIKFLGGYCLSNVSSPKSVHNVPTGHFLAAFGIVLILGPHS